MNISFDRVKSSIAGILGRALEGREISVDEDTDLLHAEGDDLTAVKWVANHFCGFGEHKDPAAAELLPMEEIARRTVEASQRGATEVCIQGGLHPNLRGDHYRNIVRTVRQAVPGIHLHAFSPFEIFYGSRKSRLSYQDFLIDLKEYGLDSIPGTAAEILDTDIRKVLTKNKLSADTRVEIVKTAHGVGLRSTSTIMYGHVDEPSHWSNHLSLLREIQKETGGFTEFVPLGFVHHDSPLYLENNAVRPGPTLQENIAMHAVARIMLHNYIDNIQVSWVTQGPKFAKEAQSFGVNDLGAP